MSFSAKSPALGTVVLPSELKGYARYVVVLDPEDNKPYSIGIRHVYPSKGMDRMLQLMINNRTRAHKKHIQAWLCKSVLQGVNCPVGEECCSIHVTKEGFETRRLWTQPNKAAETVGTSGDPTDAEVQDSSNSPPHQPKQRRPSSPPPINNGRSSHIDVFGKWQEQCATAVDSLSPNFTPQLQTPFFPTAGFSNPVQQLHLAARLAELAQVQQRAIELSTQYSHPPVSMEPPHQERPNDREAELEARAERLRVQLMEKESIGRVLEDMLIRAQTELKDMAPILQAAENAKTMMEQQFNQVLQQLHAANAQIRDLQERFQRSESSRQAMVQEHLAEAKALQQGLEDAEQSKQQAIRAAEKEMSHMRKRIRELGKTEPKENFSSLQAIEETIDRIDRVLQQQEEMKGLSSEEQDTLLQLRLDHWGVTSAKKDLFELKGRLEHGTQQLENRVAHLDKSIREVIRKRRPPSPEPVKPQPPRKEPPTKKHSGGADLASDLPATVGGIKELLKRFLAEDAELKSGAHRPKESQDSTRALPSHRRKREIDEDAPPLKRSHTHGLPPPAE